MPTPLPRPGRRSPSSPTSPRLQASVADHRAPRAARVPRPPVDPARPGLRARPPVRLAVLDRRAGSCASALTLVLLAIGRTRRSILLGCSPLPTVCTSTLAARASSARPRKRGRSTPGWPATCSSSAPRPRRARRCGSPGTATRLIERAPGTSWERWYAPVAARPVDAARCGTRSPGRCSAPAYVGAIVLRRLRARRAAPATCCSCWPPAAGLSAYVGPRSASSASCAASGSTPPSGWPGWRTSPPPTEHAADGRCPTALRRRHPLRARLVPLPRHRPAGARRCRPRSCRPARWSPSSARTAPARRRWSSCCAGIYEPTAGAITGRRRRPGRHARRRAGAPRLAGAFQDFFRFEFPAQHDRRPRRPCRASTTARGRGGRRPGRRRRRRRRGLPHGLDTQLGPTWDERRRGVVRQWQKLALARGFMRDEPLRARARRADRGARRRDRARPVRALRGSRRVAAGGQRSRHGAGLAPLLDRAHGRPHRRARRRPGGRGRQPRRADGPRAASTPSSTGSRPTAYR